MGTELIEEATCLTKHITVSTDKNTLYRLTEIIVKWVLANPFHLEKLIMKENF